MRLGHKGAIYLSGLSWLAIGSFLLYKGIIYLFLATVPLNSSTSVHISALFSKIASWTGSYENAALFFVSLGLGIGFVKGRFILSKTVHRVVKKIILTPSPLKLSNIYSSGYLLLIAGMMSLGVLLKFLPVAVDCRGLVDVAIGSALIHGAVFYFRQASLLKAQESSKK